MVKQVAGFIVAPMWREFMEAALAKYPQEYFGERRAIPDNAPPALRGVYSGRDGIHDILYWVQKDNPLVGRGSWGDGQYPYWEYSLNSTNSVGEEEEATTTPRRRSRNNDDE